jgi:hypothetical protein
MFGHYLPSFYFRDKTWMQSLIEKIFSVQKDKEHLYIAAWEGYLVNNLNESIFFDPKFQILYERGIWLSSKCDPNRKFFKNLQEGIAIHLSLAFVFFNNKFGFDHPLFQKFWQQNVEGQRTFISYLGRMLISGNNAQAIDLIKNDAQSKERLVAFWEWLLQKNDDPKLFSEFGNWMTLDEKIFDPFWLAKQIKMTLEKSKGELTWDYALTKSICELVKVAPKEVIEIVRLHLLECGVRNQKMPLPFMYDEEWFEALRSLYKDSETRDKTYTLIDDLIREGGSTFWKLKNIIKTAT